MITNEREFDSHNLVHFEFKRKKDDFLCLIPNCQMNIADRYNLKRHYVRHHYDLIVNIFNKKTIETYTAKYDARADDLDDLNDVDFTVDGNLMDLDNDLETEYDSDESIRSILDKDRDSNLSLVQVNNETDIEKPFNFEDEFKKLLIDKRKSIDQKNLIDLLSKYNNLLLKSSDSGVVDAKIIENVNKIIGNNYQIQKFVLNNKQTSQRYFTYEILEANSNQDCKKIGNFYYFSILNALEKFLENSKLRNLLLKEHDRPVDINFIRTYKDAKLYSLKDHDSNVIEIFLQIFVDDIEFQNRGGHSLVIVSGTFSNLPIKYLAKQTDQFCLLIISRKNLKKIKIEDFFNPLFDELDHINSHNLKLGSKFNIDKVFKIELCLNIGDNKALHELLKLTGSFMSDSCRDCFITYQRLNDKNQDFLFEFMVRPLNKEQVFDNRLTSSYCFPRDSFHDLGEGGCQKVLSPILRIYYPDIQSIDNLMKKVDQFKLWRHGKIEGITSNFTIKGTGMKILEFFIVFLFLDEKINRSSDHFKIISLLREIILFVFADAIARDELQEFHQKVIDFQKLYFETFTKNGIETFTMKIHYLIHYKDAIEFSGPLCNNSTLKGERFLKLLKDYFRNSNCSKNTAFSTAQNYNLYIEPKLFTDKNGYTNSKKISKENLINSIGREYLRFIDLDLELEDIKELDLDNTKFKVGDTFVLGYESSGYPIFIHIKKIFKQNLFKIIGQVLKVVSYDNYDFTYKIKKLNALELLDTTNLAHFRSVYYFKEFDLILKDFHIKKYHINQNFTYQNYL